MQYKTVKNTQNNKKIILSVKIRIKYARKKTLNRINTIKNTLLVFNDY